MTKSQGNSKGDSQDESLAYYAHPTAIVESESIGEGTKIWHFAHVRRSSKIGKCCNIGKSVYIDIGAEVGDNVKIQNFVSVYKGVVIEDDVFVGPSATFTNDLYPRAFIWDEEHVSATRICRGSSIGANATIVCGITIGEYAMIGAGSVVAEDVPSHALILGNPGRQRGWVCRCGRRLNTILHDDGSKTVYRCSSCGTDVEIVKRA
jgi:acetyltransferase-like isoleucine patch superfamily enzyme